METIRNKVQNVAGHTTEQESQFSQGQNCTTASGVALILLQLQVTSLRFSNRNFQAWRKTWNQSLPRPIFRPRMQDTIFIKQLENLQARRCLLPAGTPV